MVFYLFPDRVGPQCVDFGRGKAKISLDYQFNRCRAEYHIEFDYDSSVGSVWRRNCITSDAIFCKFSVELYYQALAKKQRIVVAGA